VRLLLIHNPEAGGRRGRLLARVREGLEARGIAVDELRTDGAGHARDIAARIAPGRYDRLAVAGGDGTVNEVVNGLAAHAAPPPLALVPLGTANVLAAEIGLALEAGAVVETLVAGRVRRVSLGEVSGRRFLLMAGVGFDAHVVAGVDAALKARLGKAAYAASFVRRLVDFDFPRYRVVIDGAARDAASVVVAKARMYGGAHVIAPAARLEAPEFQVVRFLKSGRGAALAAAAALFTGRLAALPGLAVDAARTVVLDGPEGEPVQADGDIVAHLPATVRIVEGALDLVYPDPAFAIPGL